MGFMPSMPGSIGPAEQAAADAASAYSQELLDIVNRIVDAVVSKDRSAITKGMLELRSAMTDAGITELHKQIAISSMVMALGMSMGRK